MALFDQINENIEMLLDFCQEISISRPSYALSYIGVCVFVRRSDEDQKLVILSTGLVDAQMANETDLRMECSLAVWTGNGASMG